MVGENGSIKVSMMGKKSSSAPIELTKYPVNITRGIVMRAVLVVSADRNALDFE
jgi:hypothetical protein